MGHSSFQLDCLTLPNHHWRMNDPIKPTVGPFDLTKVRLEVRGDKLFIWPNKKHPGSPVIVDAAKLDRWASRLYREGVLQ